MPNQPESQRVPEKLANQIPVHAARIRTFDWKRTFPDADKDTRLNLDAGAGVIIMLQVDDGKPASEENKYVIMGRNFRKNWNCCLGGKLEKGETYRDAAFREGAEEFFFSLQNSLRIIGCDLPVDLECAQMFSALETYVNSENFQLLQTEPCNMEIKAAAYRTVSWDPAKDVHHKFSRVSLLCEDPKPYSPESLAGTLSSMNTIATLCIALRDQLKSLKVDRKHPALAELTKFTEFYTFHAFSVAELKASMEAWSLPEGLSAEMQRDASVMFEGKAGTFQRLEPMVLRAMAYDLGWMPRPQNYVGQFDITSACEAAELVRLPESPNFSLLSGTLGWVHFGAITQNPAVPSPAAGSVPALKIA